MALAGSSPNPYQPPMSSDPGPASQDPNRKLFVLAAVGAGLASLYWAAVTLIFSGGNTPISLLLVGLYAWRGYKIFKGDVAAARAILWLHGIGAVMAVLRVVADGENELAVVVNGVKVAINVFGAITAFLAARSDGSR